MKKQKKSLDLPVEIVKEIEKYQKENLHPTFTSAVIQVLRHGLERIKEKERDNK